jgi:hypothetical protein
VRESRSGGTACPLRRKFAKQYVYLKDNRCDSPERPAASVTPAN